MNDPYSTPESDVSAGQASRKLPWLWTLFNGYVVFSLVLYVLFYTTGKTPDALLKMVEADPALSQGLPADAMVLGLMVINYLISFILIIVGYFLVWRVNKRNRWALYLFLLYMVFTIALGLYSFNSTFAIPEYQVTFLDYFAVVAGEAWMIAIFAWTIWAWRRYPYVS